ncbi:hypothetical protein BJX76DRAFT_342820 [Aspergillus varians]
MMINSFSVPSRRAMVFLRRSLWLRSVLLILLLFLLIQTFAPAPPRLPFPDSSGLSIETLRPGNSPGFMRQWTPSDDNFPPAHEPVGQGTLRDVREERFYLGGTSTIEALDGLSHPDLAIYTPYPDYNGEEWSKRWKGTFQACEGPRGTNLSHQNAEDMVLAYPGVQQGFPYPKYGSYEALGLDGYSCTTRGSRLGAYGYTAHVSSSHSPNSKTASKVSWDSVNWKTLQMQCLEGNSNRYLMTSERPSSRVLPLQRPIGDIPSDDKDDASSPAFNTRSAVILRAWHDMEWTENMKHHVRSLIMELSLHSGAEYEVFLLTHVKDNDVPLYGPDEESNIQKLRKFIPPEFWDMTIFFNERTLESWYPKVENHKPLHQHLQPVQVFSTAFPDFNYYWQLEMDARLTGHAYHFLERASEFAQQQPRKYLWERNAYFYIPGAHGSWADFQHMVDKSMANKESVWGPTPPESQPWLDPVGPKRPVASPQDDNYEWGAGEEADLISFLPMFDPLQTKWAFSELLWNLPQQVSRRASPVAMGRFSRRLLRSIHDAQAEEGVALVSEMTASSFALWHGLKAVHVPQPVYADGKWTPKELDRIMNKGPPERMNSGEDSVWNWDHKLDHILYRMTYMFTSQTAEDFYRRWLGYKADPRQYTDGSIHQDPQGRNWFDHGDLREDIYGPLCFPSMLLHPVKNTDPKKSRAMAVPV